MYQRIVGIEIDFAQAIVRQPLRITGNAVRIELLIAIGYRSVFRLVPLENGCIAPDCKSPVAALRRVTLATASLFGAYQPRSNSTDAANSLDSTATWPRPLIVRRLSSRTSTSKTRR